MLSVSIDTSIDLQPDCFDVGGLCQTEICTFHPVGITLVQRVLVDMS